MEYEEEGGYPGSIPECGAIFMSNTETKRECLERNLFGLPSSEVNFVRCIRTGMILFLFEFEKRELYGVYKACSDGEMDIVPHAFSSSGKRYPAQVCFTVVWYCKPLSEHEFRDAIKENYYSNKKFNFGLSADQVRKLLVLFRSRQLENMGPPRPIRGQTSLIGTKEQISGNEEFSLRCREEKLIEGGSPDYTYNIEYNGNSPTDSNRPDDKMFQNNCFGRNKGVTDDSMNLMESEVGLEYDVHPNLRDYSYSSRRPSEDNQFLHRDAPYSDHIETAIAPTKSGDRWARVPRESEDGRFQMRDIRGDTHTLGHDGFRLDKPVESFETSQTGFRRSIDDQRLFKDPKVDYDHNLVGHPEPGIPANHVLRRTSDDDDQLYRNNRIKIGHSIDDAIRPIVSNRLDKLERVTATRRQIPAEHFPGSLVHDGKSKFQGRFSGRISQATETLINNGFGPITSVQPTDDDHMLLNSSRVGDAYTFGKSVGPPLPKEYAELHQPREQPAFNLNETLPEAHYSLSQNQHKASLLFPSSIEKNRYGTYYPTSSAVEKNTYEILKPTSQDSVHTRAAPYDPDFPHVGGGSSHSVQYFPHHSRVKNETAEDLGPQYNGALGRISKVPLHDNEDIHSCPHRIIGNSLVSGQYHGMMEGPLISQELYENPLPFSRRSINESWNISTSVELDEHIASQDRVDRGYRENVMDQDLLVNYGMGRAHSGSSSNTFDDHDICSYQDPDGMPTDSENIRASVFSRLSTSSGKHRQEHGHMEDDEVDLSVDQVMESLFEILGNKMTYARKHSSLVKRHDTEETLGSKRHDKRKNQLDVYEPIMMTQKMINKFATVTEDQEDDEDVPRETRVVGFKRRSETKKSRDGRKTKGFVESGLDQETEGSIQKLEGKKENDKEGVEMRIKRRKLIRPSFGKKEKLDNSSKGDGFSNS